MGLPVPRPPLGRKVLAVHLYDDFSGSANVFAQALLALRTAGHELTVLVGSHGRSGFIRSQHPCQTVPYRLTPNRWLLLLSFMLAQCMFFLRTVGACLAGRVDVVYANTLLPVGAMLAARLCCREVVMHSHEVGLGSVGMFKLLHWIASRCASRIVCVSDYVASTAGWPPQKVQVVYNSLGRQAWAEAAAIASNRQTRNPEQAFVVVMACSLRWYKGLDSFVALARRMLAAPEGPPLRFELLLNCEADEFDAFQRSTSGQPGLLLVHRPPSVYQHYAHADLVLNLSHREGAVETFGLTLLEAMVCGVPVVSPTKGGCTEIVKDGQGGWRIDSRDLDSLQTLINRLAHDRAAWQQASAAAAVAAQRFKPDVFECRMQSIFSADERSPQASA